MAHTNTDMPLTNVLSVIGPKYLNLGLIRPDKFKPVCLKVLQVKGKIPCRLAWIRDHCDRVRC